MKKVLKFVGMISLVSLFALSSIAQDKKVNKLDLENFPEIEGWKKGEITKFDQPALGVSIFYRSPAGGVVTVYVYDGGVENIPDGASSNEVKSQVNGFADSMAYFVEQGMYQSAKMTKKAHSSKLGGTDGSLDVYSVVFKVKRNDRISTTETIVFGLDKHFVKFRMTRGEDIEGLENKAVVALKKAFDKYFSEEAKPKK